LNSEIRISCIICVLNEIKNIDIIKRNIKLLSNYEVIIIDGGSIDGTFEVIKNIPNIRVFQASRVGLLSQRLIGIREASNEACFLLNADDFLDNYDLESDFKKLSIKGVHGIHIPLRCKDPKTFSEYWWDSYFLSLKFSYKDSKVLGRPCLTLKKLFIGLNVPEKVFNEDTYLGYAQEKLFGKLNYITSEQSIYRKCPKHLNETIIQFYKYGRSDKKCVKNLANSIDLLFHILVRTFFYRTFQMIWIGRQKYALFTTLASISRLIGLIDPR